MSWRMAGEKAKCQGCERFWFVADLEPIENLYQRVEPGEPMPAGQCPYQDCGALCHRIDVQGDTGGYGPTIQQVVESAYHNCPVLLAPEGLVSPRELEEGIGDTLLEFLLREIALVGEAGDDTEASWENALFRIDVAYEQVARVRRAIHQHVPD